MQRGQYAVTIEPGGPVRYVGLVDRDDAGLTSQLMMYNSGTLGLAVSLLMLGAHGLGINHRRSQQARRLQEISDGIAAPHNEALAALSSDALMRELAPPADGAARAWRITPGAVQRVRSRPLFGVSEDATTVVLENLVQIVGEGASAPTRCANSPAVRKPPARTASRRAAC